MDKIKVLFIDDDLLIGQIVTIGLQNAGYDTHFQSSIAGLNIVITDYQPNVIVLDVEIGDKNSIDYASSIKEIAPNTPIIYVSSHIDSSIIVRAIDEGAATYIKKPFETEELIAYIRKYTCNKQTSYSNPLKFGNSELHCVDRMLYLNNGIQHIRLSPQEYSILKLLVINLGKLVHRVDIESCIYKTTSISEHRINNIITELRKRLSCDSTIEIETIRGIGYRMINT